MQGRSSVQLATINPCAELAVTAQVLRLANPGPNPVPVEWKLWLIIPDGTLVPIINLGADGSLVLPPGFDQDFGPVPLFPVTANTPLGTYELNCRLLDPVTGRQLALDLNPFVIQ